MDDLSEARKWLSLGYETYGLAGARAMAAAMGLPVDETTATSGGRGLQWATSNGDEIAAHDSPQLQIHRGPPRPAQNQTWREPVRMPAVCPERKPIGDPRWRPYEGWPRLFHCGYDGFLENRRPTPSQPIAECFYDEEGRLVDQNHPYARCAGTPDQYPADDSRHITEDKGGIEAEGWPSFRESRRHDLDKLLKLGW